LLKDLKESYPIEVAEYARANKIAEEPAFAWWTNGVLCQRNQIIAKLKSWYWKTTHEFGIKLPHLAAEAFAINKKNGNTHWRVMIQQHHGLPSTLEYLSPQCPWPLRCAMSL
jgi:hypothetical protein